LPPGDLSSLLGMHPFTNLFKLAYLLFELNLFASFLHGIDLFLI
jgi:hypothetical protein